jgi:hypothetical protein
MPPQGQAIWACRKGATLPDRLPAFWRARVPVGPLYRVDCLIIFSCQAKTMGHVAAMGHELPWEHELPWGMSCHGGMRLPWAYHRAWLGTWIDHGKGLSHGVSQIQVQFRTVWSWEPIRVFDPWAVASAGPRMILKGRRASSLPIRSGWRGPKIFLCAFPIRQRLRQRPGIPWAPNPDAPKAAGCPWSFRGRAGASALARRRMEPPAVGTCKAWPRGPDWP